MVINNIDALILNQQDTTLEFVKQVYTLLTERQLLPPVKIYETLQQTSNNENFAQGGNNTLDFFGKEEDAHKEN